MHVIPSSTEPVQEQLTRQIKMFTFLLLSSVISSYLVLYLLQQELKEIQLQVLNLNMLILIDLLLLAFQYAILSMISRWLQKEWNQSRASKALLFSLVTTVDFDLGVTVLFVICSADFLDKLVFTFIIDILAVILFVMMTKAMITSPSPTYSQTQLV